MARDESKITLRQLEIFLRAVEHRSFAKAAKELGLTAPAVSMQMTNLGKEFGAALFEKEGRNVRPTLIAAAILPFAERMIATLDEAVSVVGGMQGKLDNKVRVAMVTTARNFGPHLIQAFSQVHPEFEVELTIENRSGVVDALESRQVDIALMGRTPRRINVEAWPFAAHPYVLVSSPHHPLARRDRIAREDLVKHLFLIREAGSGTRMVHDHFFTDAGLDLPDGREMDSNANIKQAVMANMGLAFISAHTIALEHETGKLCILNAEGMPEYRDWFVLNLKGAILGEAGIAFRDFVRREGATFMQEFFGERFVSL